MRGLSQSWAMRPQKDQSECQEHPGASSQGSKEPQERCSAGTSKDRRKLGRGGRRENQVQGPEARKGLMLWKSGQNITMDEQ